LFRAASFTQALDIIGAMFGAGGHDPAPAHGEFMPHSAVFALLVGAAIVLAPIVTKYRELPVWRVQIRSNALAAASLGYFALFLLSSIHLTNMRFTPLIYFKF